MGVSTRRIGLICVLGLAFLLSACGESEPDSSDKIFEGFDPALVDEVLKDPSTSAAIRQLPEGLQSSAWQYNVAEFGSCRSLYGAYQDWLATGVQPEYPPWPRPAVPEGDFGEHVEVGEAHQRQAFESGDPSEVQKYLTAEMSCGTWVPVRAYDRAGDTIADALGAG